MLRQLLFSTALVMMLAFASAAALTSIPDAADSIEKTVEASSVDLAGVGPWNLAPVLVTDDDFRKRGYILPFRRGDSETDIRTIRKKFDATQHKEYFRQYGKLWKLGNPGPHWPHAIHQLLWGLLDRDHSASQLPDGQVIMSYGGVDLAHAGDETGFTAHHK